MSFAIGSSKPELLWFLIPSDEARGAAPFTMERRAARRRSDPHRKGAMYGGEGKQQHHRRLHGTIRGQLGGAPPTPPGYFTAELVLAFLFVAVSLALLPLVLPPLSPPPFLLLLVPVGLLAFVPLDAQSHLVGSSRG